MRKVVVNCGVCFCGFVYTFQSQPNRLECRTKMVANSFHIKQNNPFYFFLFLGNMINQNRVYKDSGYSGILLYSVLKMLYTKYWSHINYSITYKHLDTKKTQIFPSPVCLLKPLNMVRTRFTNIQAYTARDFIHKALRNQLSHIHLGHCPGSHKHNHFTSLKRV